MKFSYHRRRVSSLLQSDFRVRLDHVIQSYLARQDQAFDADEDWMLETDHQDSYEQSIDENDEADESTEPAEINVPSGTVSFTNQII